MRISPYRSGARRGRSVTQVLVPLSLAAGLAACGSSGTPSASSSTASGSTHDGSCAGVVGAHHARVVIETAPGTIDARCVGFSSATIKAATLLADSHAEMGTQKYSFGLAVCQLDNVPAHYTQCLPSGANYWAMFVSKDGQAWAMAQAGIGDTTLSPGDSLGFRYDPPTGTAAPPPPPTPA